MTAARKEKVWRRGRKEKVWRRGSAFRQKAKIAGRNTLDKWVPKRTDREPCLNHRHAETRFAVLLTTD